MQTGAARDEVNIFLLISLQNCAAYSIIDEVFQRIYLASFAFFGGMKLVR